MSASQLRPDNVTAMEANKIEWRWYGEDVFHD